MAITDLLNRLLRIRSAARIAIWLRLRYPKYFTAEEIAHGIPFLSVVRMKQVLKEMHEAGLVDKRLREVSQFGRKGPPPFEYKLKPPLFELLRKGSR